MTENGLFFLDSGAFSLKKDAVAYAEKHKCSKWKYYDSKEFWAFADAYGAFVNKYKKVIDYYANLDAIPNPELSWRNQQYLEKEHGLKPVPIIHFRTDLKWISHYIDKGYDLIGLGGLVGPVKGWIDGAFKLICQTPTGIPKVRVHGFGVTGYEALRRWPWWSVDSSSWTKIGAFGGILVPHKRSGKFTFETDPYVVAMSDDSPGAKIMGKHYSTYSKMEKTIIHEWLEVIKIPLGKKDSKGEIVEYGVTNRHSERKIANLLFFEQLRASLPKYPWAFKGARPKGFLV